MDALPTLEELGPNQLKIDEMPNWPLMFVKCGGTSGVLPTLVRPNHAQLKIDEMAHWPLVFVKRGGGHCEALEESEGEGEPESSAGVLCMNFLLV